MASHAGELSLGSRASAAVSVRGLRRAFGGRAVLCGVDFDIQPGEFVALLGKSGSGKSTLLRSLAALEPADAGELRTPARRAVVFQDARLLPWARVLDNVTLGLSGAESRGRAALAEVGLAGRERAWPMELSGGEQQRVALARSLVREPELMLLDEPFGALDALTRLRMHELLRELCARHRPSVLLVTHDVDEAIALSDRVLMLDGGTIALDLRIAQGEPRSPAFVGHRETLLSALGVRVPHDMDDGASAGLSARTGRYATRLERTA